MKTSRVSILMPVYNGEQYLSEAIESILHQSFIDFEFIILDDGSTDRTKAILDTYQTRDKRLIIKRSAENRGLSTCLNEGRSLARGEYVARMDADDISLPHRLAEQVAFLDQHPDISICGTWAEAFSDSECQVWKYPTDHETIHASMLFACTLVHPSVMLRLSDFNKRHLWYDINARHAEDYELWSRALPQLRFANIPSPLLKHRLHPASVGAVHKEIQRHTRLQIYSRMLEPFAIEFSENELYLHDQIGSNQYRQEIDFLIAAQHWLEQILHANQNVQLIDPAALEAEIALHWTRICMKSNANSYRLLVKILSSSLPFNNAKGLIKIRQTLGFLARRKFLS